MSSNIIGPSAPALYVREIPLDDNTTDIGRATKRYRRGYVDGLNSATATLSGGLRTESKTCDIGTALAPLRTAYLSDGVLLDGAPVVTHPQLATELADYATTAALADYATTASLADYATTAALADYATTASLADYATTVALENVKRPPAGLPLEFGLNASGGAFANAAIGNDVIVTGGDSYAFGRSMTVSAGQCVSLGIGCDNAGFDSLAVGQLATVPNSGYHNIAIGQECSAGDVYPVSNCIAIGHGVVNTTQSSFKFGDANIQNIRPNSTICNLGDTVNPFVCMYIGNSAAPPTLAPTDGGVLFVEEGELKFLSSLGSTTTIAPLPLP